MFCPCWGKKKKARKEKKKKALQEFCWASPASLFFTAIVWNLEGRVPVVLLQFPWKTTQLLPSHKPLKSPICICSAQRTQNFGRRTGQGLLWRCCLQWANSSPGLTGLSQTFLFFFFSAAAPRCCRRLWHQAQELSVGSSVLGSKCRQNEGRKGKKIKKQPNGNRERGELVLGGGGAAGRVDQEGIDCAKRPSWEQVCRWRKDH